MTAPEGCVAASCRKSSLRRSIATALLITSAVLSLTAVYWFVFREYPRTSDNANPFLAAQDMIAGNWRLDGWWLPSDSFWTSDLLFEAALIAIVGSVPAIMWLAPAALWAAVVAASGAIGCSGRVRPAGSLFLVAAILGVPVLRANDPMNMITYSPVHIGSILYILAIFLLAARVVEGRKVGIAWMACIAITGLAVAGDPLVLVLGVLPVIAAIGIVSLTHRDRGQLLALAAVFIGGILGKAIVAWNAAHGGFHAAATPFKFVPFDKLGSNIAIGLQSILLLTGTNFFGRSLEAAAPFLVRLPLLLLMVLATASVGYKIGRHALTAGLKCEIPTLDYFLLFAVAINIAAAILSDLLVDAWSARYFLPAIVFTTVLAARALPPNRWITRLSAAVFAATLLTTVVKYVHAPPRPVLVDPMYRGVADWLLAERLTNGYASYWSASIITVATQGQVRVRAVDVNGSGHVEPKRWLSRE